MRWDPAQWAEVYDALIRRIGEDSYLDQYIVAFLSRWRLNRALRSFDSTVQSLAFAAFVPPSSDETGGPGEPAEPPQTLPGALVVSTMIHGTWGWKGDWWRSGCDFHRFVLQNYRPDLYSRGAKFSWSGAYSASQRRQATQDFRDWAYEVAPHGLQTVFAHSYGAEVAALGLVAGAGIHELVLLSAPATAVIEDVIQSGVRVVDVRLRVDPILAIARARQRLPSLPNVTPVILNGWRLDHGSTHRQAVWRHEDIGRRGGL
ncbi:MAG: hypothetical protein QOG53_3513 [Frankiales bacterium]|nr:hypothetical protein [Frankiales bacterium]